MTSFFSCIFHSTILWLVITIRSWTQALMSPIFTGISSRSWVVLFASFALALEKRFQQTASTLLTTQSPSSEDPQSHSLGLSK